MVYNFLKGYVDRPSCESSRYDPCSIRGGARRSLVSFSESLTYPPSPNYSLLGEAFVAGDCGPGAVVAVVNLMCELFPQFFDMKKVPRYTIEVRCLVASLLMRSTLFESHFQSADSLSNSPRDGTLFSGILHRASFQRSLVEANDSAVWRRRLALLVCPGEGSLTPDSTQSVDLRLIVWFTLDIVCILVRYLLRQAFMGDPRDFDGWCTNHGPARHSCGPICYVPGVAPWLLPINDDLSPDPYDSYAVCVLHVGTHFQVHVRRTEYLYNGTVATTIPHQISPGHYDSRYNRTPLEYRKHVLDPEKIACSYITRYNTAVQKDKSQVDDEVVLTSPVKMSSEVTDSTALMLLAEGNPDLAALPFDMRQFRFVEPIEVVEQVMADRDSHVKVNVFGCGVDDVPNRLTSFEVAVQGSSKHDDFDASDLNFKLACRPRLCFGSLGEDLASKISRGDYQSFVPLVRLASEQMSILVTGPSCIPGRGAGLFVFDAESHFNSGEQVVNKNAVLGWFNFVPINETELSSTRDSSISELIFDDGPRYFYMHKTLLSIQSVWCRDGSFENNCSWLTNGNRVCIQTNTTLFNCQECYLPFGWTYGPTRNKSPFVCYQIWQGHQATILGTRTSFHHRLAWLLTKDFVNPTPRYLMRTCWKLHSDPPSDVLVSVFRYNKWLESLRSSFSLDLERVAIQTSPLVSKRVLESVPDIPRKKVKSRQRRRIAAALLRTSVAQVKLDTVISTDSATMECGYFQESLTGIRQMEPFPGDFETQRQKSIRRAWRKWEHRYASAQQRMWTALQVLAAEPSELHFADQLREIAVEFSSTPDCSDNSEYIAHQRAEGNLMQFDLARLREDEKVLVSKGLDAFIESRFVKFPGLGYDDLYQFVSQRSLCEAKRDKLFELLEFGQAAFMLETFVPNGCSKAVKNGVGYDTHKVLCEHTAAKLYSESRCLLVREELLVSRYLTKDLHVSPCNTVHKEGAVKRVVTDLSHGRDKISSYNHSVNLEKHLEAYPRNALPTLRHIATLACQMRREHKGAGLLHGGVVDVRTAYQQYRLSLEKAKLVCTRLFTRRKINGFDKDVAVIMIALTGTFGDVGAGDTYAILGDVFHELHNAMWALWRSVTYVDDMLILAPPLLAKPHPHQLQRPFHTCEGVFGGSADGAPPVIEGTQYLIHQAVTYARNLIGNVLGEQATEPRKSKWYYGCLMGIGWYFNLIYSEFYVLPKPEKLRKIVHYLFNVVPVGSEIAPYTAVRELQGLLCWFSAALPLGKSFVYSLFRCRPNRDGVVSFSAVTIRDLDFWRSLARCAMVHPNLFGTKLENLAFGRKPTYFVRTDACTSHGGGGWLSKWKTWVPGSADACCFVLRWTEDELQNINKWLNDIPCPSTKDDLVSLQDNLPHYCSEDTVPKSIWVANLPKNVVFHGINVDDKSSTPSLNINVLEFATAVFAMMLWAPKMQGSCVCIGADNTATLCWLVKHKTTNLASDVILKILALTCAVYNIQLVTEFIPGVQNVLADWLSRFSGGDRFDVANVASELCGGTQGFFRENLHIMASDHGSFSRRLISRTILMRSLTIVEPIAFRTLLSMILALKGDDDTSCDVDDVQVKGTLDGIASALNRTVDGALEVPMNFDDAVERFFFRPGNALEQQIFSTNVAESVLSSTEQPLPEVLLTRKAKILALKAINKTIREPPENAYRIPQIKDLPGVKVSIAPSTHQGANLGLYLTRGPAPDGSAPKGTRLAKYNGRCFVTTEDIARIENLEYQSDYLWGKLNPLTRVYTIVDAADPKSCYSRYVNEGFFESNCEVILGSDDVLYLVATTDIAPNEELTMPYGVLFWTFPKRWMSLPPFLQEAIIHFYDCTPPDVSNDDVTQGQIRVIGEDFRSGFGPEYSSDNAGDGPRENAPLSGWGARQNTSRNFGKGWNSILSPDKTVANASRDRLQASFPLLHSQAMASCHAPSTLRSYGTGWKSWSRYCEYFGKNPMCYDSMSIPIVFHDIIAQIQNYVHFECAIRQIQPDSIKSVYLAGISDYFDRHGVINRFREASNHNCVQLVLNSYSRTWNKKHPASSKVKIAFGLPYAMHAENLIQSGALTVGGYICSDRTNLILYMIGVRLVTALWFGIFFLLRKNEFLPHIANPMGMQEPCKRQNLRFFDKRRLEIPYIRVGLQRAASVSLHLRFSKTDQTGHGRIVQHESSDDPHTCVVHRLEEYIRVSRDYFQAAADSLLFSVPGLPTDLSSAVLTEVMRDTTTSLGLPANLISAHSLRYGGATALSQAGFPEYIIAFYGGWVDGSLAMRRYIVQSAQTRRAVSDHMGKTAYASSLEELVRETLAGRDSVVEMHPTPESELDVTMGQVYASLSRKRKRKN